MKFKILLLTGLIAASFSVNAQSKNKGYAITGDGNKDFMWMNIRQIDLSTGKVTKTIFQRSKTNFSMLNLDSKKSVNQTAFSDGNIFNPSQYPTSSFVAAAAYDKRSDKLFFIPMRIGELRWMDANVKNDVPQFYSMAIPGYIPSAGGDEANNITRMVLASDGYGYAATNDGNHLYKFSTGKKPSVTDLGSLIDGEESKDLSVHSKCSSWGGDMIADAFGKLYIISATRNVFVVDVNSRLTTFKGTITGLPGNYTTNGAAVDADGNIILCSATTFDGYYKMSLASLAATKMEGSDVVFNASDLASGNLLLQKEADQARSSSLSKLLPISNTEFSQNSIYPNPVVSNTFNVLLDGKQNGTYNVVISDLAGRALQSTKVGLAKGQQSQKVILRTRPVKGTYIVKVVDEKNNEILSDKVIIL
jgi:hypothetical protein